MPDETRIVCFTALQRGAVLTLKVSERQAILRHTDGKRTQVRFGQAVRWARHLWRMERRYRRGLQESGPNHCPQPDTDLRRVIIDGPASRDPLAALVREEGTFDELVFNDDLARD